MNDKKTPLIDKIAAEKGELHKLENIREKFRQNYVPNMPIREMFTEEENDFIIRLMSEALLREFNETKPIDDEKI